jgi:uncharacterized protein YjiS (DUF1127 family)
MSLINLVVVAINAWVSWRHRQRAYDELVALNDRLLADIGLGRTDIPAIFYERVRRESVDAGGGAMALSTLTGKARLRSSWAAADKAGGRLDRHPQQF